jgi:hypothetical protein
MSFLIKRIKATICMLTAALLFHAVRGCQKPVIEQNLVGKWQSSRLTTPIYLHANGEWEIKKDDGGVLQYGIWRLNGRNITWSYKAGSKIGHDGDPIVSSTPHEFRVRENDGSTTTFKRLE